MPSISGIAQTLGNITPSLSIICNAYGRINQWAKYRPTGGGYPFDSNRNNESFNTLYKFVFPEVEESNITGNTFSRWTSRPELTYCSIPVLRAGPKDY